jgi:Domain of unknown function (DUF4372)
LSACRWQFYGLLAHAGLSRRRSLVATQCPLAPAAAGRCTASSYHISGYLGQRDEPCGDRYAKSLRCAEHFRVMAFAQLTYRESLRDIEACLSPQVAKLYHIGFREPIRRSTLSDANEARDWRIYADFAQVLIR